MSASHFILTIHNLEVQYKCLDSLKVFSHCLLCFYTLFFPAVCSVFCLFIVNVDLISNEKELGKSKDGILFILWPSTS